MTAWSRLPIAGRAPSRTPSRSVVERSDLAAACARVLRERWGTDVPVSPAIAKGNTLVLSTPSAPWRAELLLHEQDILDALHALLPTLSLERVRVTLR